MHLIQTALVFHFYLKYLPYDLCVQDLSRSSTCANSNSVKHTPEGSNKWFLKRVKVADK